MLRTFALFLSTSHGAIDTLFPFISSAGKRSGAQDSGKKATSSSAGRLYDNLDSAAPFIVAAAAAMAVDSGHSWRAKIEVGKCRKRPADTRRLLTSSLLALLDNTKKKTTVKQKQRY